MTKLDTIIAIVALSISTTFLFQNCSNPSSTRTSASVTYQESENDAIPVPQGPPPEIAVEIPENQNSTLISNRNFNLDNKAGEGSGTIQFSLGNGNILYFETDYLAMTKSTVVQIEANATGLTVSVTADTCSAEKNLTTQSEVDQLLNGINLALTAAAPLSEAKNYAANESQVMGCGFPRFVISSPNLPDYDLFLSDENCVPEGDLYVVETQPSGVNNSLRTALESHYKSHIDGLCGL